MQIPIDVIVARDSFLLAFPALFSIINPVAAAIIFLEVAGETTRPQRAALARLVAMYTLGLLICSAWFGSVLLGFFGITINALRVAGGLFVARGGWVMLQSPEDNEEKRQNQIRPEHGAPVMPPHLKDIAFFPVTMPFTVGPGTISVMIALSSGASGKHAMAYGIGLSLASLAVALTVLVAYTYADRLTALLGVTGTRIMTRLAALILLSIGVQIVASGVLGFANDFMHAQK